MRRILALSAVFLLMTVGCTPGNQRKEIAGNVTLHGSPLDEGVIEFHPLSASTSETPATQSGAVISNGTYTIPAEQGLVPGKYKVLITSGDGQTPENSDEPPGPSGNFVSKDRIPPEFNRNSKVEVEVTNDKVNQFSFDIP